MVHRRAGAESIPIGSLEVLDEGVRVIGRRNGLEQSQVVPWDRVAGVDPPQTGRLEAGLAAHLEVGELLWRGRTRLLRNDARLALGPFSEAWSRLKTERSEPAALAAEGLVRASIARARPEQALVPALALVALHGAGFRSDRFDELPSLLDSDTGLVADLPPILDTLQLGEAITGIDEWIASAKGPSQVRGQLFRAILLGEPIAKAILNDVGDDKGIAFLSLLVDLRAPDSALRARTRQRLLLRSDDWPLWRQAWTSFFVGQALIQLETDPVLRRLGVLQLLNIPPLGAAAPAGLIKRSLRLAARTAAELGRDREATILESLALPSVSPLIGASETSP